MSGYGGCYGLSSSSGIRIDALAEADQVLVGDPAARDGVAAGAAHGLAHGNRPAVLDESDEGAFAGRDRVGDAPLVLVVEDVPVGQLAEPPDGAELHALLACGAEADQGADGGAERKRLVGVEVALLNRLDHAVLGLAHGEQVDEADDVAVAQALELGADLAVELGVLERDHEDLDGADGHGKNLPRERSAASTGTGWSTPARLGAPAARDGLAEFIRARCRNAAWAAGRWPASPRHASSALACSARPYEYESGHGPPIAVDRVQVLGRLHLALAAGEEDDARHEGRHMAQQAVHGQRGDPLGRILRGQPLPAITMFGFSSVPRRCTSSP